MDKVELEALVAKALKEHPDMYPGAKNIVEMLRKYNVNTSTRSVSKNIDTVDLQVNWLNSCSEVAFFESVRKNRVSKSHEKCKEAIDKRLKKIIEAKLESHPEVFPSSKMAGLLGSYGLKIQSTVLFHHIDFTDKQMEWMGNADASIFLRHYSNKSFNSLDKKCIEAAQSRLYEIVKKELEDDFDVFPSSIAISRFLKNKYGAAPYASSIRTCGDLSTLQVGWLKTCDAEIFLKQIKAFNNVDPQIKEAAKRRLMGIITDLLKENPSVLPSGVWAARLLKRKYDSNISNSTVTHWIDFTDMQKKWIATCEEKIFLDKLRLNSFNKLRKEVIAEVYKRVHGMLLSHIDDIYKLPIHPDTLKRQWLVRFPDIAFLLALTHEHKTTLDQKIVLKMHVWRETRSEHLHKLIGARLDQLWGFRELFALMKDGRCLDADVISMFHESLPERIGNYISESTVTHSFVDNLRAGDFKAGKGKDVLLLSFMHWLTDKQSAEIMLRLNQSVGTDNAIYMTSPNGLEYAEDLIASMNTFGFVPEKVGSLYLIPPSESEEDEQRKLLTKGKVLQFRKIQDVEKAPEELQLFSREKKKKGGARIEPKADIISYDEKTLKKSLPLITMKDVGVIFTEEIPEVKKVEVEGEHAILTLKGGLVLGFNVEPEHPYSIEVEGRKIPKGTDNAILDITNGKEGFEVGKGLKKKYKDFMKLIGRKREHVGSVKKRVLKRKG